MSSYHDEENRKDIARLRELQKELPLFLGEFFRARGDYTAGGGGGGGGGGVSRLLKSKDVQMGQSRYRELLLRAGEHFCKIPYI